jgi:DNA replication and repair protein RecF
MSIISSLDIHCFRNICTAHLDFSDHINLITGLNGSGKTSVLEAIYLLSRGGSFRTRLSKPIIQNGMDSVVVRGCLHSGVQLAIQKNKHQQPIVKVNNEKIKSASELVNYLPIQIIYDEIFQLIDNGPAIRRKFLDWGVLYSYPQYHQLYCDFKKALQHRNSLLRKQIQDVEQYHAWELQLVNSAIALHSLREKYIADLVPVFKTTLQTLSDTLAININYHHGWGQTLTDLEPQTLLTILDTNRKRELELGHTVTGPNKADLKFTTQDGSAKDILSRGQQKLILIALKLSQGLLLKQQCLYLFDDLLAELDKPTVARILDFLVNSNSQVIITSLDYLPYKDVPHETFSIAAGDVSCGTSL